MSPITTSDGPIFIGGTGRSGTSVMADLLRTHPQIVLPVHENKLIVERRGLRDLVDTLSGRFDIKSRHYAVTEFANWAQTLRTIGFRDAALNARAGELRRTCGMSLHRALETVGRENPGVRFSLHAIGQAFGLECYDHQIRAFIDRLTSHVAQSGIVDTEGLIAPFITTAPLDRAELLAACRTLLAGLYADRLAARGASRWCDDTPSNWLNLDFLFELYPDFKFIHMIRDPRDVLGSYLNQTWAPPEPRAIVATFKAQFSHYRALAQRLPEDRVLELRLEDISAAKTATLERLSEFLGVENRFDGAVFLNEKTHTGDYADELGGEALKLVESELADWMGLHGYL